MTEQKRGRSTTSKNYSLHLLITYTILTNTITDQKKNKITLQCWGWTRSLYNAEAAYLHHTKFILEVSGHISLFNYRRKNVLHKRFAFLQFLSFL